VRAYDGWDLAWDLGIWVACLGAGAFVGGWVGLLTVALVLVYLAFTGGE
jgi:hypothetical protein